MFEIIPLTIPKEEISKLEFPTQPIEHSEEKKSYLTVALKKAMELGNEYKQKFRIIFYDAVGIKEVETTVWNSTQDAVVLKNGVVIPTHRLVDIKLS